MTAPLLLASASAFLVSFYKPVLMFAVFLPWAWLISSKLEKDAQNLRMNRRLFNAVYLGSGVAALGVMLAVPIFWIGWPLGIVILVTPVYVYWQLRNKEVPPSQQFYLTGKVLREKLAPKKPVRTMEATLRFLDPQGDEVPVPRKDDPRRRLHLVMEDLVVPALAARASRVDLAVGSRGCAVTQIVDGVRYKRQPLEPEEALRVIDYLKEAARLNVKDRRRRQAAEFQLLSGADEVDVYLVTAGSSAGQEMRLVFNRAQRHSKPIDGLGLLPAQLEAVRSIEPVHDRHGIFLFGAPSGHGLTTTAYSLVARHDAYTSNVKTLELEVESELDGVDQVTWDPSNPDVDYATNLQSILRRDPDVVLVGSVKDRETARVASEPGMEGPLIYIPMRGVGVAEQVRDWVKVVGEVKQAVRALRVVMNQRLVRAVCPHCRQPYQPSPEQLRKMNLPPDKVNQLFRASGKVEVRGKIESCPVCGGTGYLGQVGVFQVMVVDDEVRQALLAGDLKAALAAARRNKMIYLQEAALRKVVEGTTTIEEVARVFSADRDREAEPQPAADAAVT